MIDGRNKLFFFANYQRNYDNAPAQSTPTSTVPANEKHLNGDFSDLLALPNGSQYQIYDPLTARPDPARPGSIIRTPFPNNIIPRDRFMNPTALTRTRCSRSTAIWCRRRTRTSSSTDSSRRTTTTRAAARIR